MPNRHRVNAVVHFDVWESVCCSREIFEGLATGWPIGQPVASRLASPMSCNHQGLEIFGQDWPGWPRFCRDVAATASAAAANRQRDASLRLDRS